VRYPRLVRAGTRVDRLVLALDIAPTLIELAGGTPGPHIQGRSLVPLLSGARTGWRSSFMVEYFSDNAMPWLVGMSYKAVRTDRHKYIRWINRGRNGELDELYDLDGDPYELVNVVHHENYRQVRTQLHTKLRELVADAMGL
jgi:arylsulfatase A-like enzyme